MKEGVKWLAVGFAKFLVAVLLILASIVGYATYKEHTATTRAEAFCQTVEVGAKVDGLQERAVQAGADARRTKWFTPKDGDPQLTAMFLGFTPISRHTCWITAHAGHVTEREVVYLD